MSKWTMVIRRNENVHRIAFLPYTLGVKVLLLMPGAACYQFSPVTYIHFSVLGCEMGVLVKAFAHLENSWRFL